MLRVSQPKKYLLYPKKTPKSDLRKCKAVAPKCRGKLSAPPFSASEDNAHAPAICFPQRRRIVKSPCTAVIGIEQEQIARRHVHRAAQSTVPRWSVHTDRRKPRPSAAAVRRKVYAAPVCVFIMKMK
ncbi:hypothetical protein MRX96_012006 [Rhipicephalus microplus]